MHKSDACVDCGVDVMAIGEYAYMVRGKVWSAADMPRPTREACEIACLLFEAGLMSKKSLKKHLDSGGKLCIGCLEGRLGRPLVRKDFNWEVPLTSFGLSSKSDRLRAALTRV